MLVSFFTSDCLLPFMSDRKGKSFCVSCEKLMPPPDNGEPKEPKKTAPKKAEPIVEVKSEQPKLESKDRILPRTEVSSEKIKEEIEKIRLSSIYQAVDEIYQRKDLTIKDKATLIDSFLSTLHYFK